jgi:hypothetical protein
MMLSAQLIEEAAGSLGLTTLRRGASLRVRVDRGTWWFPTFLDIEWKDGAPVARLAFKSASEGSVLRAMAFIAALTAVFSIRSASVAIAAIGFCILLSIGVPYATSKVHAQQLREKLFAMASELGRS